MIYNYQYGFSGFAAKLNPAEAQKLKSIFLLFYIFWKFQNL